MSRYRVTRPLSFVALALSFALTALMLAACGGGGADTPPPPSDGGVALTDAASMSAAANASAQIASDAGTVAAAAANPASPPAQRARDALFAALRILSQSDVVQRLHPGAGGAPARPAAIPAPPASVLSACVIATGAPVIDAAVDCTYIGPAGETVRITGVVRIGPNAVEVRLSTQVTDGNTTVTSSIDIVLAFTATSLDGSISISANVRRNGVDVGAEQSVRFENIAWDGCAGNRPHTGALEVRQTLIAGMNRVSVWVRVTYGPACGQIALRIGGN
jgi:hypothetical protein